jgi:SOS response regulatory protein OraA/RecX
LRIEADLVARGLPEAVVTDAIETSREGEPEREWARRAVHGIGDRARAWRLLVTRGFPEDVADEVAGAADDE